MIAHRPTLQELHFRQQLLSDEETMSYTLNSRKIIHHFQYSSESSIFLEKRREKCLIFLLTYDIIRLYVN